MKYTYGTRHSDYLIGTSKGQDYIDGGRGNDFIIDNVFHKFSDDFIFGGKGNDTIYSTGGYDRLYGERGNDDFYLFGNDGLLVDGGKGHDEVFVVLDDNSKLVGHDFHPADHYRLIIGEKTIRMHDVEVVHFITRDDL